MYAEAGATAHVLTLASTDGLTVIQTLAPADPWPSSNLQRRSSPVSSA